MIGGVYSGEKPSLPQHLLWGLEENHGSLFSRAGLRVTSGNWDLSIRSTTPTGSVAIDITILTVWTSFVPCLFSRPLSTFRKNEVFCREWFPFLRSLLSLEDYPISAVLRSIYTTFTTILSVWTRWLLHPQREDASCCFVTAVLMGTCGQPSERDVTSDGLLYWRCWNMEFYWAFVRHRSKDDVKVDVKSTDWEHRLDLFVWG